jgi:hypothetical protein
VKSITKGLPFSVPLVSNNEEKKPIEKQGYTITIN